LSAFEPLLAMILRQAKGEEMKNLRCSLGMACFALSVGCLTTGVLAGQNLVKNPSFEIDADGDGVPDQWTHGAGHYGRWQEKVKKQLGKGTLVDKQAASGKRSILIAVPKNNEGKNWNQGWEGMSYRQKVATKPLTTYTMSMKVLNKDAEGLGDYGFIYAMAGEFRGSEAFKEIRFGHKPSGEWVEKKVVFQTGRYASYTVLSVETRWNIGTICIDDVRLEEGGKLELSQWDQPVPEDRLLPVKHQFARPDGAGVLKRFEAHHAASEKRYRGDGSWESRDTLAGKPGGEKQPPDLRATYQRLEGYLGAYAATGRDVYLQRAKEGAAYLLKVQQESGIIGDNYYSSGQGGVALVHAWQKTGDQKYLDAVGRVVGHFSRVEPSWNYNYNMMLTEAALAWSQATDKFDKIAARLQTEMLQSTLREQRPWGGWAGHNSRIGYHCANMSALCQLYQTLPKGKKYDQMRAELKRRVIAALNRMIREQVPKGGFPYVHGQPGTARQNSGITGALIHSHETFGFQEAKQLLYGQMTYLSTDACGKYYWLPKNRNHLEMSLLHSEGMYLEWAKKHVEGGGQ
jgi:hypothetical protein